MATRVLPVAFLITFALATPLLARAPVHGLLHLALDLLTQLIEPIGGEAHGVLVAADNLLGSILNRPAQLGDILGQLTLNVTGLVREIVAHEQRQLVERLLHVLLPGTTNAIFQLL